MSEVEGQLRVDMARALAVLAETARHAADLMAAYVPQSLKAEQPERFEHRDIDNDRVLVYPHDYPEFQSVLMVETDGDSVRLSQDAVNGLAQYLDRYRTDIPCPEIVGIPEGEQCAGTQGHEGPCSPDADMIGAPVTYPLPTGDGRCTGLYEGFRCRRLVDHEGEHA